MANSIESLTYQAADKETKFKELIILVHDRAILL